jgi:hypothetical protein
MDTFVVRVWIPGEAANGPAGDAAPGITAELHGTAHHVASGRATTFRTGSELLGLLSQLRQPVAGAEGAPSGPLPVSATAPTSDGH